MTRVISHLPASHSEEPALPLELVTVGKASFTSH